MIFDTAPRTLFRHANGPNAARLQTFPNKASLCVRKSANAEARLKALVRKGVKLAVTTLFNQISTSMGHSGITTDKLLQT
jgi:hypothetical protein